MWSTNEKQKHSTILKIAKQSKYDLVRFFVFCIHLLVDIVAKKGENKRLKRNEMKKNDENEEEEEKKQECFHLKFILLIYVCRLFIYNRSKNAIEQHKKNWRKRYRKKTYI